MAPLPPGTLAPDFALPQTAGQPSVRLSELRGQPVVLAFSPPGWDPSRAEGLAQTRRLLSEAGFPGELRGLSHDGVWSQATFGEGEVRLPLVTEAGTYGEAAQQYGVSGQQALFALDAEGVIQWRFVAAPGVSPRAEDLRAGLQALMPREAESDAPVSKGGLTRRDFLTAALGVALALSLPLSSARAADAPDGDVPDALHALRPPSPAGTVPVTLRVNGVAHTLQLEPRVSLLDALRERLNLTGSKKGCDHGQCGACTVHADGRRINSCLALAIAYQGREITTVEGLAQGDTLHPVQAAFIKHDGFQCGFCTPGQIMSAVALLKEPIGPEDADVRENMSGNLCRCGAYTNIVAAVQDVRKGGPNASV